MYTLPGGLPELMWRDYLLVDGWSYRSCLARPNSFDERCCTRPTGQLDQLGAQMLLERTPRERGAGGEFITNLLGNVANCDGRSHACILLPVHRKCGQPRRSFTRSPGLDES